MPGVRAYVCVWVVEKKKWSVKQRMGVRFEWVGSLIGGLAGGYGGMSINVLILVAVQPEIVDECSSKLMLGSECFSPKCK